jgi:hypothetical protein
VTSEIQKYEPLAITQMLLSEALSPLRDVLAPGETLSLSMLEQAKVPTGGALSFVMHDGESERTIEGVIVLRQAMRVFWRASFDESGGGAPPDCSSTDMLSGVGDPGGECATCPLEYSNSYQQEGPRCTNRTRLFVLTGDSFMPMRINLPATSFAAARDYAFRLSNRGTPPHAAITRISLDRKQSQGGIAYAVAKFELVRKLDEDERQWMLAYRGQIVPRLLGLGLTESEEAE